MKYAYYDKDYKLKGWYDKEIHSKIPTPNIEVSDLEWKKALSIGANFIDINNNKVIFKNPRTPKEIKAIKREQSIQNFNNDILKFLDEICFAAGFTGDNKTRPYRAIANYVGYDNVFRESAEKLGAWIALVFQKSENILKDISKNKPIPKFEDILQELPIYEN